jgi:hypothetical protein
MALILRHNGAPTTGALFMKNPKRAKRRPFRRNPTDLASLPLVGGTLDGVLTGVQGVVGKVPFVGGTLSQAVPALVIGAGVGVIHHLALRGLVKYAPDVANKIAPVAYSTGGLLVALIINKVPQIPGSPQLKNTVAALALGCGAAFDLMRWYRGTSRDLSGDDDMGDSDIDGIDDYGDGNAFAVLPMGDSDMDGSDDMSDPDIAGIHSHYHDAEFGDANYCGNDMGDDEVGAALAGAASYLGHFGQTPSRVQKRYRNVSRHAGKRGHRYGWLIRLVGFKNFQKISAMEPERRASVIKDIRKKAIEAVNAQAQNEQAAETQGLAMGGLAMGGLAMSGLAMGGSEYGSIYAGSVY